MSSPVHAWVHTFWNAERLTLAGLSADSPPLPSHWLGMGALLIAGARLESFHNGDEDVICSNSHVRLRLVLFLAFHP